MADRHSSSDAEAAAPSPPSPPPQFPITLLRPSHRNRSGAKSTKLYRTFISAVRSLPILPAGATCSKQVAGAPFFFNLRRHHAGDGHVSGAVRATGTLFGRRRAGVSIAFQETPRSHPLVVLGLAVPVSKFMKELGEKGSLRVALECEKRAPATSPSPEKKNGGGSPELLEEPEWSAFADGRRIGYARRREPTEVDMEVMKLLHAVSMGAGVLPVAGDDNHPDGELTYMRSRFDRAVGSKDSETFYMLNPDGASGSELTVFIVRI